MKSVIGLMSGTSMDAIDVAWLRTDGEQLIEQGPAGEFAYLPQEREAVRKVLGSRHPSDEAVKAVTDAHIRAVAAFLQVHPQLQSGLELIGFHGQTTFHDPAKHVTVQIGSAQRIADHFRVPVVHDFRSADVAAGGEGAPFAPLYHQALAVTLEKPLAVLNLGGVGNVTWMNGEEILAFDTGPASAMIDDWMLREAGKPLDHNGETARQGNVDSVRVRNWMSSDYFAKKPPKSLDRNDFEADVAGMSVADGAATLLEFTVESVSLAREHMPASPLFWIVTGGGRKNVYLMERLRQVLGVQLEPVEAAGWNGDALEAQCFAWLAVRSRRGLPLSLPATTGVPEPMTGGRTALADNAGSG